MEFLKLFTLYISLICSVSHYSGYKKKTCFFQKNKNKYCFFFNKKKHVFFFGLFGYFMVFIEMWTIICFSHYTG